MKMTENRCAECGDTESVPKSVAWDALWQIPPKTEKQLEYLKELHETVVAMTAKVFHSTHWEHVTVNVNGEHVGKLIETCKKLEELG